MRRILLRIALALFAILALGVAWIFAAPSLASALGRTLSGRVASLPIGPGPVIMSEGEDGTYHAATFQIGGTKMSAEQADFRAFPLRLRPDAKQQMTLGTGGRTFTFGPLSASIRDDVGRTVYHVAAEPGDEVRFQIERSFVSWPTPFRMNFMTGARMPSWSRYLFYVFSWQKPSGARLEMLWRFKQDFDAVNGWQPVWTESGSGGLIRVTIAP